MGLLDKFKKNAVPERVNGAAMLFCPLPDCRKILEQIEELFHMEHVNEGNNITLRQGDMEIVFVAVSPEEEGENGRYAREQLQGAAGYVYQNEAPLLEIKRSLFYHLRQCKCLVQIGYSFDSAGPGETKSKEKQIMAPILTVTETLQGVVTLGNSMAMLNGRGQVILDKAGKSQLEDYMPSELPLPEDWAKDAPPESLERRNRSMELLREKGIYVTPWLPLLWEKAEEPGRRVEEVCARAAALLIVELFPRQLIGIFGAANESAYYTDYAIKCFRVYLCMMPLAAVNKGTFIYLQSLGKAFASTAISMVREVLFGVGFALLLPMQFGLDGVLYSMPVSDLLTFLICLAVIVYTCRTLDFDCANAQKLCEN